MDSGRPSAITSGYSVAQLWERNAPLTAEQQNVVDLLSQPCSRWPFQEVEESLDESVSGQVEESKKGNGGVDISLMDAAKFSNSEEFYKWFSEAEAMYLSEKESKFKEYEDGLSEHSQSISSILHCIDGAFKQFESLKMQQLNVRSKTATIQSTCDRLSKEGEQLEEFANQLKSKLSFFDDLHRLGNEISLEGGNRGSADGFIESMAKIDECVAYLQSNPQYADSAAYLTKFRSLQHKAMSSVKQFVSSAFAKATSEAQKARAGQGQGAAVEATLLYVKFKAAVPDIHKVIEAIQSRLSSQHYSRLMHDLQGYYAEKRIELLSDIVEEQLYNYQSSNDLPMLTRLGCAYLVQVTQTEYQLFQHFFPASDVVALSQVVDPLCTILYDILRPYFINVKSITSLCQIINILKVEILDEQFQDKEEALASMRPIMEQIVADVQGRLVYAMQHFIRDEVTLYIPSSPEDLLPQSEQANSDNAGGESSKEGESESDQGNGHEDQGQDKHFSRLYPPVQNTLLCLSKTYGCLEAKTFGGLAQETIQNCTDSCVQASQEIAKSVGLLDSQLFLIQNLLALREQLGMFDVDFGSDEMELDFTHMRDHLRRILRGESSLFAVGASNAVFQLMNTVRPRVHKMHVDSKKDLEKRLKASCESYIMAVTKLAVDPMLSFITKVTATKVANTKKPLKDHAFATPSRLVEIVKTVAEALESNLPEAIRKMKVYVNSPNTQTVLFKPIKSNIAEAHGQIARLLETEYDAETIQMVPLTPPQRLMAILDALS
mmetsp:Transcript_3843/g.9758  ORF Transcript_3843/g.9758 Transcript_3843/m.9758 type:complete len:775 (+) Transcript_3843:95-2419(+)